METSAKEPIDLTGYTCETEVTSRTELVGISGCKVTLEFADKPNPQVQTSIADLLINAFVKRCNE